MGYLSELFWFTNYEYSDLYLLDESINWDGSFDSTILPFFPVVAASNPSFINSHFTTSSSTPIAQIDFELLLNVQNNSSPSKFYWLMFLDLLLPLRSKYNNEMISLYHADYQNYLLNVTFNAPELALALNDWFSYWLNGANSTNPTTQAFFDSYNDATNTSLAEFRESILFLVLYVWTCTLVFSGLRIRVVSQTLDPYLSRLYMYFTSLGYENRIPLTAVHEVFFLVALYFVMMIITFDDDQEEVIEICNLIFFYIFLIIFVIHTWKHSIHYFSFLDSSRKGTSSVFFIFGQFLFDLLNLAGFSIRFLLLMLRLNIYDGIDDILDSYYILLIDFDEEEYYIDSFPDFTTFSYFDSDSQDDRSFLYQDENDLTVDFYTLYTLLWGKYVFYLIFVIEEICRVCLALFVTALLILEINAVNRTYDEDVYLTTKLN